MGEGPAGAPRGIRPRRVRPGGEAPLRLRAHGEGPRVPRPRGAQDDLQGGRLLPRRPLRADRPRLGRWGLLEGRRALRAPALPALVAGRGAVRTTRRDSDLLPRRPPLRGARRRYEKGGATSLLRGPRVRAGSLRGELPPLGSRPARTRLARTCAARREGPRPCRSSIPLRGSPDAVAPRE